MNLLKECDERFLETIGFRHQTRDGRHLYSFGMSDAQGLGILSALKIYRDDAEHHWCVDLEQTGEMVSLVTLPSRLLRFHVVNLISALAPNMSKQVATAAKSAREGEPVRPVS